MHRLSWLFNDIHTEGGGFSQGKAGNKIHESKTGGDAVIAKKGGGKEGVASHSVIENRNGLVVKRQLVRPLA
jgi:hypothetical protein